MTDTEFSVRGDYMHSLQVNEKHLSQIPALQLWIRLGFDFLTQLEALREKQGRSSNALQNIHYVSPLFTAPFSCFAVEKRLRP